MILPADFADFADNHRAHLIRFWIASDFGFRISGLAGLIAERDAGKRRNRQLVKAALRGRVT